MKSFEFKLQEVKYSRSDHYNNTIELLSKKIVLNNDYILEFEKEYFDFGDDIKGVSLCFIDKYLKILYCNYNINSDCNFKYTDSELDKYKSLIRTEDYYYGCVDEEYDFLKFKSYLCDKRFIEILTFKLKHDLNIEIEIEKIVNF